MTTRTLDSEGRSVHCAACGVRIHPTWNVCDACAGTVQTIPRCAHCGTDISDGHSYLGLCVACAEPYLAEPTVTQEASHE